MTGGPDDLLERMKALLDNMNRAADDVGLKDTDPLRFMMRMFGLSVFAAAEIVAHLARGVTDACSTLKERKACEELLLRVSAEERKRSTWRHRLTVLVLLVNTALAAVTATTMMHTFDQPVLAVDFGSGDTGVVRCPSGAKDERGDLHCSMAVVLTSSHRHR